MTYLSWAVAHEGPSDGAYFETLLPRVIEDAVLAHGVRTVDVPAAPAMQLGRNGRGIDAVAKEVCEGRDAIELLFVHADTGGRALEASLPNRSLAYCARANDLCDWPIARCVQISPRHETEAWNLADPAAVLGALGYHGDHRQIGLPDDAVAAERLPDPKVVLQVALGQVAGPRRRRVKAEQLFPAIAQRQSLAVLRRAASFQAFETGLKTCLRDMAVVR